MTQLSSVGRSGLPVLLAALLALAGSASAADSADLVVLPDGRRLNLECIGNGGPTVILESGLGLPVSAWSKVQQGLAGTARVCTYSRAGYGPSDPGPLPRDAAHASADLEALVSAARLPPPYVLVGHSLGGQYARLFAARHEETIAGLVLVDPIFGNNDRLLSEASPAMARFLAQEAETIRKCVGAIARGQPWTQGDPAFSDCGPPPPQNSPFGSAEMAQATLSEFEHRETSARQVQGATRRKLRIPIIVLTASGKRPALQGSSRDEALAVQAVMVREHRAIAMTSTRGSQRDVPGAGHVIQFDRPEAVVEAVQEIVSGVRPPK